MQPPFQQSAASAHIDDLLRAAQSYRLTAVDSRRGERRFAVGLRAALTPRPRVRKPQHA